MNMKTPLNRLWGMIILLFLMTSACQGQKSPTTIGLGADPSAQQAKKTYSDIIVGFNQIGAESEWRSANTLSVKETAEELGVELRFFDGQQKQENQLRAMHSLIVQKVHVIGISPVVETG